MALNGPRRGGWKRIRASRRSAVGVTAGAAVLSCGVQVRLAINELRSAQARRERYVGEWLPEPIITDGEDDPARHAETADSL